MDEQQLEHAQAKEIIRFQLSYNKRKIKSTWILAALFVVVFLLEEYFGGSQNMAVLVRMGANVAARVKEGEYYRLFTCVFLHAGFLHIFFNTYVLFALGGFFNRILGESKYLTVLLASGFFGSLTSVYFAKSAVSVGASGAIWGLFGASLTLALFKTSLLPDAIRLRLRKVTLINLVINLGISFLPMVDMWAHFGGGIAGFLISLMFVFEPKSKRLLKLINISFSIAASLLVAIYVAAFALEFYHFKPWIKQLESPMASVNLDGTPFSVDLPQGLKEHPGPNNATTSAYYVFGNPQIDQVVIELHLIHESITGKRANNDWLIAQRDDLLKEPSLPAKVKKTIYYRDSLEGGVLYYQQPVKNTDLIVHNYLITRSDYVIKLGVMSTETISQQQINKLATIIIKSLRPTSK